MGRGNVEEFVRAAAPTRRAKTARRPPRKRERCTFCAASDSAKFRSARAKRQRRADSTFQTPMRMSVRVPAALTRPSCAADRPRKLEEGAGKAGCRPHPWPACKTKSRRQSPQVWPNIRPSLRDGFNAYIVLSLGTGLSCSHRPRDRDLASLAPASGRQDHTILRPQCHQSSAQELRADTSRPSHPALHVRDDRETPLLRERNGATQA
jgi:hypothetical protein